MEVTLAALRWCLWYANVESSIVYSPEMPDVIPKWVMIKRAIDTLATGIKVVLRAILVISIWLVILPYLTIWMWRLYFWIGDRIAFTSNGLEIPVKKVINMATVNNATSYEQMDNFTRFVHRAIPPEYKFFR